MMVKNMSKTGRLGNQPDRSENNRQAKNEGEVRAGRMKNLDRRAVKSRQR
jgi:hypothetical protein